MDIQKNLNLSSNDLDLISSDNGTKVIRYKNPDNYMKLGQNKTVLEVKATLNKEGKIAKKTNREENQSEDNDEPDDEAEVRPSAQLSERSTACWTVWRTAFL